VLSSRVPELAALQLLLAVQATGSLGAAGAAVGVTQQAASLRIRTMEQQVGVQLVERSRAGSRLTPAGALLAQWAAPVLDAAAGLDAGIASLRDDRDAHLRVVASLTVAEHLAPRWFLALRAERESTGRSVPELELTAANSDAVVHAIADGAADLGFIEGPRAPAGVRSKVVAHDRLVLVVSPRHPWARRRSVPPRLVARTPLVCREPGSGTRESMDRALRSVLPAGTALAPPAIELASTAACRAAIVGGTAPGALSELAVADDLALRRLVALDVPGIDLSRSLRAVWRSGAQPPAGPARDLVAVAGWS
jgi:DNA-binding transcriptional LysR family regulator